MRGLRTMAAIMAIGGSMGVSAADLTDSWRDPADPGWGLSVVQDGDTLTVGLFVHDEAGRPRWYSGVLQPTAAGASGFEGALFETSRGGASPQAVRVGEIALQARADGEADLDYRIGTAGHHSRVQRLAFAEDRLEGLFFASMLPGYDACPQGFQGLRVFEAGMMLVERCEGTDCLNDPPAAGDRSPFHLVFADGSREICSIDGRFARYGRSGAVHGSYHCADGGSGAIEMQDIEFTSTGFQARFTAQHPQCREFRGILGGMRADAR